MDRLRQALTAEVEHVGLRPFARQHGLPVGVIRSIMDGRDTSFSNTMQVAEVLRLPAGLFPEDSRAGLVREIEIDGQEFASIPRVSAEASAGPGAVNGDAEVVGSLAFRRTWLREHGIKPGSALLVTVTGDSMRPSIQAGDLVLLDRDRTEIVNGRPYIFVDVDGETRLKRLHRLGRNTLALVSDNPDHPPELRDGTDAARVQVIGQVVWSGHKWG